MTTTFKTILCIAAIGLSSAAVSQDMHKQSKTITKPIARTTPAKLLSFPAANLPWQELAGTGGIKYANMRGDLAGHGPYEAFVIFPAGKDNPYHFHTRDLPTVVLKGTFYAVIDGKRTEYPAGSFYDLPAKLPHYSGCTKAEDCLLFQYQTEHFDLVPTAAK